MEQQELLGKSKVYLPSLEYGAEFKPKAFNTNRKIHFDLLAVEPTDGKRAFTKYSVLPPIGQSLTKDIPGNNGEHEKAKFTQLRQHSEENIKIRNSIKRQRDWKKCRSGSASNSHLSLRRELFQTDRRTSAADALLEKDDCFNNGNYNSSYEFSQEVSKKGTSTIQEYSHETVQSHCASEEAESSEDNSERGDVEGNEQEKPTFSLWKTKMLRIMNRYKEKFQNVDGEWKDTTDKDVPKCPSEHISEEESNNNSNKTHGDERAGDSQRRSVTNKEKVEDDEVESDEVQPPPVSRRDAVCRTNDEQLHYFLLLRNLRDFGLI